jgi:ribosomal protein S18 acetylase RimI-like enzyme
VQIRDAVAREKPKIVALTLAAYHEYSAAMSKVVFGEYMENIERTLTDDDRARILVIEDDGAEIVASTMLYPSGLRVYQLLPEVSAYPEVRLLAVAPHARRRGLGKALMNECIARVRNEGASGITLHTSHLMQGAMALYLAMGFERYPEIDFYPEPDLCVQGYLLGFSAD